MNGGCDSVVDSEGELVDLLFIRQNKLFYFFFSNFRWKILAIVMLTTVAVFLIGAVVGIIYMTRPCCSSVGYARHL